MNTSEFVVSVLMTGDEALTKDPDLKGLGFSEVKDRVSILVEEPAALGLERFRADLVSFLACTVLCKPVSSMGMLIVFST